MHDWCGDRGGSNGHYFADALVKVAIVGSKDVPDSLELEVYDAAFSRLKALSPALFISGGAKGVDSIAAQAAAVLEIEPLIFKPSIFKWAGPGGFEERNRQIAETCDHLIRIVVIVPGTERTYGSGWTRDLAVELGKTVEEIIID